MTILEHDRKLIADIVGSYIEFPSALQILPAQQSGATYWNVIGDPEDQRKIVGRLGAHIKALDLLILGFGRSIGAVYRSKLPPKVEGDRREFSPPVVAKTYDPENARQLLQRTLCRLLEKDPLADKDPAAIVRCSRALGDRKFELNFLFEIITPAFIDWEELTREQIHARERTQYIEAVRTLWNAFGCNAGVGFEIEILPVSR